MAAELAELLDAGVALALGVPLDEAEAVAEGPLERV